MFCQCSLSNINSVSPYGGTPLCIVLRSPIPLRQPHWLAVMTTASRGGTSFPYKVEAGGAPGPPTRGMDLHEVCKRAADKLDIPWPKVQAETSVSCYEGKRLPKAKRAVRQLLPIFPECLEEMSAVGRIPFLLLTLSGGGGQPLTVWT